MVNCIFCRIVAGEIPCHKVWEDASHLAFLNITPSMKGFTVVAAKKHLPSNVQDLSDSEYHALCDAGKSVARRLSEALGVDRCAIVAEGTGVDHAHVKLIPLIGLRPGETWKGGEARAETVFERYEGFVSTKEGPRADDAELASLAQRIRQVR
ncbi:HIT domain-containing protein [Candidatus Woesearchaeota archaeon]|nr:HIT domain-containing protein [Candidatus Woesearchaeota archaeon]